MFECDAHPLEFLLSPQLSEIVQPSPLALVKPLRLRSRAAPQSRGFERVVLWSLVSPRSKEQTDSRILRTAELRELVVCF